MATEKLARDPGSYCRELESYLCQKNEGHLIRIVGPAFERVCSWAERGIPLKIAFRGIDRYCERYHARPGRRRPVRIEFCEADILDAFDEWRRAVGVGIGSESPAEDGSGTGRKPSLSAHIDRVLARLRTLAAQRNGSTAFLLLVDDAIRELEQISSGGRAARGEVRTHIIDRLASIDRELTAGAARELDEERLAELTREAEAELAPFGDRLTASAREKGTAAAYERLVREEYRLPVVTYE
jgi:hypothetical protein